MATVNAPPAAIQPGSSNVTPPHTSPRSSASITPGNSASPTSPQLLYSSPVSSTGPGLSQQPHPATRQLRPPKCPIYIPAVLRPTEKPPRPVKMEQDLRQNSANSTTSGGSSVAPPTPPRSVHSSTDSLAPMKGALATGPGTVTARPSTPSPPILTLTTTILRSSTSNSSAPSTPASSASLNFLSGTSSTTTSRTTVTTPGKAILATATPIPTRQHWKPDIQAPECDAPGCATVFSLLIRRHHCRRCGNVFCAQDAGRQVPLDERAEFSPRGAWSRSCDSCWGLWNMAVQDGIYTEHQQKQASSAADSDSTLSAHSGRLGKKIAIINGVSTDNVSNSNSAIGQMAATSVPKDWSWSTF